MSSALRRMDPWPLLRSAPIALPQLLALLALVVLSAPEGGFPIEHWAPGAIVIALLLLVALVALPLTGRRPSGSRVAILCITGYALWTAASLLWANDQGAAAIASTRTAFLATTFVLFARWRHRPRAALTVLTALTFGFGILSWGVVFELMRATNLDPWFLYDRLLEPVGYVNAGAAFWGIGAFLGVGLLGGALPMPLRVLGALVAVPAAALSLLCLSRGGLIAAGMVVILLLAFLPGRARNATALLIPGLGLAVGLPQMLDVGDAVRNSVDATSTLHGSLVRVIVGTALAALLAFVWASLEGAIPANDRRRAWASRAGAALLAVVAVVTIALSLADKGPLGTTRIRHAVDSITQPYSAAAPSDSRLTAGLNSGRWDFWTVAWHQFQEAPWIGKGADNFRMQYLLEGKSPENPRYPHSLWLRSLGQLGIIGTLMLLGWVLTVAVSVRRLAAGVDPAGRAVALAAGGAFGLWVIHGSADWLLEYAGLSAIVAAIAGLVVSAGPPSRGGGRRRSADAEARVSPQEPGQPVAEAHDAADAEEPVSEEPGAREPGADEGDTAPRRRLPRVPVGVPVGALLLLVTALWSGTQWIADRDRTAAAFLATDQPQKALARADRANALEPFGEQNDALIGALAVKRGDLAAAEAAYEKAYARNPRATRPRLWLGVLASARGDASNAKRWMRRATRTAPRDAIVADLTGQLKSGKQLVPSDVQQMLSDRTAQLVRDPDPVNPAASNPPPAVTAPAAAG